MTPKELSAARKDRCENLRKLRIHHNITIWQLHKISGLSFSTVRRIESGDYNISINTEIIYLDAIKKQTS